MRSVHSMPFGSEPLARGGVRFALWAPATTRVELCFEGAVPVPMERDMDGWAQNHDQTVDWSSLVHPEHRRRRQWIRRLLRLRQQEIVPLLALGRLRARMTRFGATGLGVEWTCADGTAFRRVPVAIYRLQLG